MKQHSMTLSIDIPALISPEHRSHSVAKLYAENMVISRKMTKRDDLIIVLKFDNNQIKRDETSGLMTVPLMNRCVGLVPSLLPTDPTPGCNGVVQTDFA